VFARKGAPQRLDRSRTLARWMGGPLAFRPRCAPTGVPPMTDWSGCSGRAPCARMYGHFSAGERIYFRCSFLPRFTDPIEKRREKSLMASGNMFRVPVALSPHETVDQRAYETASDTANQYVPSRTIKVRSYYRKRQHGDGHHEQSPALPCWELRRSGTCWSLGHGAIVTAWQSCGRHICGARSHSCAVPNWGVVS
jgi:hypothetical protein